MADFNRRRLTPLLGMSEVVRRFLMEHNDDRLVTNSWWPATAH
jgi:hypothetical protein